MWWKISLIALFSILVICFVFSMYACIRIGSKSEDDYTLYISKSKHTSVRKRGEDTDVPTNIGEQ